MKTMSILTFLSFPALARSLLRAWCTRTNNGNEWLQVYFGRETTVTKVATQGRYDADQWVTSYSVSYSVDGTHWAWYRLVDGHIKVWNTILVDVIIICCLGNMKIRLYISLKIIQCLFFSTTAVTLVCVFVIQFLRLDNEPWRGKNARFTNPSFEQQYRPVTRDTNRTIILFMNQHGQKGLVVSVFVGT